MPKFVANESDDIKDDDEGADYIFDDAEPKSRDTAASEEDGESDNGGSEKNDDSNKGSDSEDFVTEELENSDSGKESEQEPEQSEPVRPRRPRPERRRPESEKVEFEEPEPERVESESKSELKSETEKAEPEKTETEEEPEDSESAVPKEYADKWYDQAVSCCKHKAWPAAVNAVKEMFDIVSKEERTSDMYCVAAVAACKTFQFKAASDYAKEAYSISGDPKCLNIRALIYIDKYKADIQNNGGKPKSGDDKYPERAERALEAAIKLSENQKNTPMWGAAEGLLAELYSVQGDMQSAVAHANEGISLNDPWGYSKHVLKRRKTTKRNTAEGSAPVKEAGTVKQNVLTVIGIVLFFLLSAAGGYWVYLNNSGYKDIPTMGLVSLAAAAVILIVSVFSLTFIWAANAKLRRHGAIPVVIITVLDILVWVALLVFIGYRFFV